MKLGTFLIAAIALLLLASGCKPSNRVVFKPALVSIDLGKGWQQMNIPVDLPACSPQLLSKYGMINAVMVDTDATEVKSAADTVRSALLSTGKVIVDTLKLEDFTTDRGMQGVHISYSAQSAKSSSPDMRSHSFVIPNGSRKYVSISYITSPEVESAAVIAAIIKTARVE